MLAALRRMALETLRLAHSSAPGSAMPITDFYRPAELVARKPRHAELVPAMSALGEGDRVAYSVQWLRSVGMRQSPLAHARGRITELSALGSTTLARVAWDDPDVPERVNVANLARVGPNTRFCEV